MSGQLIIARIGSSKCLFRKTLRPEYQNSPSNIDHQLISSRTVSAQMSNPSKERKLAQRRSWYARSVVIALFIAQHSCSLAIGYTGSGMPRQSDKSVGNVFKSMIFSNTHDTAFSEWHIQTQRGGGFQGYCRNVKTTPLWCPGSLQECKPNCATDAELGEPVSIHFHLADILI